MLLNAAHELTLLFYGTAMLSVQIAERYTGTLLVRPKVRKPIVDLPSVPAGQVQQQSN